MIEVHPIRAGSVSITPLRPSFHPPLIINYNATSSHPRTDILGSAAHTSSQSCRLHLEVTLPDEVFVDRDELADGLHSIPWRLSPNTIDIERPSLNEGLSTQDVPMSRLRLDLGSRPEGRVKIPMHARYVEPSESGLREVWLMAGGESGDVFGAWLCEDTSSALGQLFEAPLLPVDVMAVTIQLPAGKPSDQSLVEAGTVLTVWLCFAYLAYKIIKLYNRAASSGVKVTTTIKVKMT